VAFAFAFIIKCSLQQSSGDWLQNCIWYAFCVPCRKATGTEPP